MYGPSANWMREDEHLALARTKERTNDRNGKTRKTNTREQQQQQQQYKHREYICMLNVSWWTATGMTAIRCDAMRWNKLYLCVKIQHKMKCPCWFETYACCCSRTVMTIQTGGLVSFWNVIVWLINDVYVCVCATQSSLSSSSSSSSSSHWFSPEDLKWVRRTSFIDIDGETLWLSKLLHDCKTTVALTATSMWRLTRHQTTITITTTAIANSANKQSNQVLVK